MRLIDADALVVDLEKRYTYEMADGRNKAYGKGVRDAIKDIWSAPTVGGWISVKDRLPKIDDGHYFLVVKSDGFMEVAFFQHKGKRSHWGKGNCKITHWMPLPEPPKEENDATD